MKKTYLFYITFVICLIGIFHQTFFWQKIPFPGDLLLSTYKPWKSYSYDNYVPGSYPTKNQYFDTLRQFYPWEQFTRQQLSTFSLPLWNPYTFSGSPLLANHQSRVFYPLTLLTVLLPYTLGWTILVIWQHAFSFIFMYLYAKRIGIHQYGSLLAAISFSFSLFASVFSQYVIIGHTLMWLPFIWWCVEQYRATASRKYAMLLLLGLVSSFLAGHLQLWGALWIITGIYGFARLHTQRINWSILLMIGLGLSAVQVLPTLELIFHSARGVHSIDFFTRVLLLQPYEIVLHIFPDLFGNPATHTYNYPDTYPTNAIFFGTIPLFFTLVAITHPHNNVQTRFLMIASIVGLLLLINSPFSRLLYIQLIPWLSQSSPSNWMGLYVFFTALLSGIGFTKIQSYSTKRLVLLCASFIAFSIYLLVIANDHAHLLLKATIPTFVLLIYSVCVLSIKRKDSRWKELLYISLLFCTIGELGYYYLKFNPFVPSSTIFPSAPIIEFLQTQTGENRIWGFKNATIDANFTVPYHLYSPNGYDPLYPRLYSELLASSQQGKIPSTLTETFRSDATLITDPADLSELGQYRESLRRILGVRYIIDRSENASDQSVFPPNTYSLEYESDDWKVFDDHLAYPRVMVTGNFTVDSLNLESLNRAVNMDSIILSEDPGITSHIATGSAAFVKYSPHEIIINTEATSSQILFLSDSYYPGWFATIDTVPTKIYRAFHALRAVVVPAGQHTIIFKYQPSSFSSGLVITMISTGFGLFFLWWRHEH